MIPNKKKGNDAALCGAWIKETERIRSYNYDGAMMISWAQILTPPQVVGVWLQAYPSTVAVIVCRIPWAPKI